MISSNEEIKKRNQKENEVFSEQIDKFIAGKMQIFETLSLGHTPNILYLVGATAKELTIKQNVLKNAILDKTQHRSGHSQGHNIPLDIIKQLPEAIRNPILLFNGQHPHTVVVLTELKDTENKNVIVPIALDLRSTNSTVNKVTSVYGKKSLINYLQKHENSIIAINIKKAEKLFTTIGYQLPKTTSALCFDDSIAYSTENVNRKNNINLPKEEENTMTQEEMLAEFQKMQAEINAMKQTISEQSRQLKTINSFLSAMTAAQDFEKTMIEVESVTEQITECEKAEFYCYDSSENKFFTSGGDYREWTDIQNADELKNAMKNTEITFTDNGKKALIPVASSDNTVIGIVSAVKEQGFEKTDLSPLKKGSEIISTIDLAVQKEMNHRTAVTDELTKLKNRDGLNEYLKKTMVNSLNENKTVNIVMCDIDKFKSINDTYGHDAGDIILKGVADVLRNGTRTGADCAFRMGGEEMVCILNCSPEKAVDIAEQLRMKVENTVHSIIHEGAPLDKTVTVSMGVHTMKPTEYATPENIRSIFDSEFKNADNAVYEAKETGRNKVVAADENVYKGYMAQKAAEIICTVNSAPESIPSIKADILSCFAENDISSISDAVLSAADELTDKNMQQTAENLLARLSEYAAKKPVIDTELDDPEIVGTAEFIHESNKDRLESFDPVKAEKALEAVTEKCDISAEKVEQLDEKLNDIAEKQQERQSGGHER